MPRQQRRRKRYTRRDESRLRRKNRNMVVQPMAPIGQRQLVRMRYADVRNLAPALAGQSSNHVYSANSLFDPDRTGVGHQPRGYDEWADFYSHYIVVGSKITVRMMPTQGAASQAFIGSITLHAEDTQLPFDLFGLIENNKSEWKVWAPLGSSGTNQRLVNTFSAKKFFNKKDVQDADTLQGAMNQASGGNPTDQAYYHVGITGTDPGSTTDAVSIIVEIEYLALLLEPKTLVES